ncbi:hypothetical protein [Streptomyces sp. NPDC059759]|uniref:hypothetical protein n=1 Tax=Streptomyces sp. NPDC059759 TaxID=3346936 RepID=UPI003648AA87
MTTSQQNPDGTWSPAEPLPLTNDFDIEIYGHGPWAWTAHRGAHLVAQGRARTRLGLWAATTKTRIRHARRHP